MAAPDPTFVSPIPQASPLSIEYWRANPIIPWDCGILLVKDNQHRYIASNKNFQLYSGINPEELVGLTDVDMPWKEDADIYKFHEKNTMAGIENSVVEFLNGIKKTRLLTTRRIVYNSKGIPSGLFVTSVVIHSDVIFFNMTRGKYYKNNVKLTKSETKVLCFLLQGGTRSSASLKLGVSIKSYDHHLHNLKIKFSVDSVNQLILLLCKSGFYNVVN